MRQSSATRRQRPVLGLIAALVLALCSVACDGSGPGEGSRSQAILDGVLDTTHSAVGRLLIDDDPATQSSKDLCSGTLVGARTVLTAAHCVSKSPFDRTPFLINGVKYAARALVPHPDWNVSVSPFRNDLGLVLLVEAPPVAPAMLRAQAPVVGESVVVVGFGVTRVAVPDSGGTAFVPVLETAGKRRSGEKVIGAVEPRHFELLGRSGNSADGDSGGPVFAGSAGDERLIGVVSASGDNYETSYHVRVDAHLRWLRTVADNDVRVDGVCLTNCDGGLTARDAATTADSRRTDARAPRPTDAARRDGAPHGAGGDDGGCVVVARQPSSAAPVLAWLGLLLWAARRRRRRARPAD